MWKLTGPPGRVTIDLDATLLTCHSDKEGAAGNFKGGYGFHPMLAYCDETREALAGVLRPGNAGANTAADQIAVADAALEQILKIADDDWVSAVTHEGDLNKPFALGGITVEDVLDAGRPEEVAELERISESVTSRRTPSEALAHLETLDDEILVKLRHLRGEEKGAAAPAGGEGARRRVRQRRFGL